MKFVKEWGVKCVKIDGDLLGRLFSNELGPPSITQILNCALNLREVQKHITQKRFKGSNGRIRAAIIIQT